MYRKIKDKSGIMKVLSNNGYDVTKSIFDSTAVVRSMNEYANEKVKEVCQHDEVCYIPTSAEYECAKCKAFIEVY